MNEREKTIRLWFDMWLNQQDMGIDDIFAEDVIYTESWSPQYNNRKTVKHWFQEWNTRGRVVVWEIKQFFHKGDQTIVEWYFKNEMNNGSIEEFDGISLVEWTKDNKLVLVNMKRLDASIDDHRCAGGYFSEYRAADLKEIVSIVKDKYQTLAYYGFDKEELEGFITDSRLKGIDRIVPFGETTSFSFMWDGYNLIETLSRECSIF